MIVRYDTREKVVGAFMLSIMILLALTVLAIGRSKDWFREKVTYFTTFKESYNLETNAAVKLFNADIGKVTEVSLVGNVVHVRMAIFAEYAPRIRKDSIATVQSVNYIGNKYISITPGTPESPELLADEEISSEEQPSVADLLAKFEVEETAKKVIRAVQDVSEVATLLRDPEGPLFEALNSINNSLNAVEVRVGAILDSLAVAVDKMPHTVDLVDRDLEKVHEIGMEIQTNIALLQQVLENVEVGSRDVPAITETTVKGIEEIRVGVEQIDEVVKSLKKSILIRGNLPPGPEVRGQDAGTRP
ncbi:MlaD family protein [Desulfoluna butyratoxydans]|uniref:Mce/mlad n=1 Tax=Desulfoluna butyratoxydans TaxID=231438 RepID=A0A4U8YKM4_9BACT|nr:MlaD family protein [Desulfoluna butyratoxydans]VFQ43669.1 mce/mlad [Desulfoluna butyratoxydans]